MLITQADLHSSRILKLAAGLRPYRSGSPRLDVERMGDHVVAHNYGHGGSGITMSWGSCSEIVELLKPWTASPRTPVAVLGAGVMGLCAATLLQQQGHDVRVYARDFPPNTTSNVAGGLWAPTHVGVASDLERHERILTRSWHAFRALDSARYGVEEVDLYETDDRAFALDPMPEGLTLPPRRLSSFPFPGPPATGQVSRTLLIETPRYLEALFTNLRSAGATMIQRSFSALGDLAGLQESVVVNCLGLGAREVAPDDRVSPIRGQLVVLRPAPGRFFLDHAHGYVISRKDCLILGGTFEEGVEESVPVEAACEKILRAAQEFFGAPREFSGFGKVARL